VRAGDLLKSAGESKIGGCVSRASSVTSPLFDHLPTQTPPLPVSTPAAVTQSYSISGRGRRDGGLLHLRPREAWRRSSPSPAEGGAAEVFFNSGLVLQIRGDGLKWRRYITMTFGSFCPYNCLLVMSADLVDPHCRSIFLGRPVEPDSPGSSTSCCDSGLDPPPPQKSSYAHNISTSELWSDASTRSREDCQSELHLEHEWCWGCTHA
jgi:hypothetical protein